MKKKLYYVIDKELQSYGDGEETTGFKTVTTYEIFSNELEKCFMLDLENVNDTIQKIKEYLSDNGYGDDEFDLVRL